MRHVLDNPPASSNMKNVTERQKMWEILQHWGDHHSSWKPTFEDTIRPPRELHCCSL